MQLYTTVKPRAEQYYRCPYFKGILEYKNKLIQRQDHEIILL